MVIKELNFCISAESNKTMPQSLTISTILWRGQEEAGLEGTVDLPRNHLKKNERIISTDKAKALENRQQLLTTKKQSNTLCHQGRSKPWPSLVKSIYISMTFTPTDQCSSQSSSGGVSVHGKCLSTEIQPSFASLLLWQRPVCGGKGLFGL